MLHHAAPQRFLGLIADTHGLMPPEAVAALAGAERIIHASDIGRPDILHRVIAS
jgi:hypothetical protein